MNGAILQALRGLEIDDQEAIDAVLLKLDGTANKERLGGNALLGVSLACASVAAAARGRSCMCICTVSGESG